MSTPRYKPTWNQTHVQIKILSWNVQTYNHLPTLKTCRPPSLLLPLVLPPPTQSVKPKHRIPLSFFYALTISCCVLPSHHPSNHQMWPGLPPTISHCTPSLWSHWGCPNSGLPHLLDRFLLPKQSSITSSLCLQFSLLINNIRCFKYTEH